MTRQDPTTEERFAAEVIRRVGGWSCTYADVESDGIFDWWLERDGRREGGVQVTNVGDQKLFQAMDAAGDVYWPVPEAQWCWMLTYSSRTAFTDIRRHLSDLVQLCEREGVNDPRFLPFAFDGEECVRWFERSGCTLHGFPEANRHGVVDVVPQGGGGFVSDDPSPVVSWLEDGLADRWRRKIDRFVEIDVEERQLFLVVHDSGLPFSLYHPVAFSNQVPDRPVDAPDLLTAVWLLPNWGSQVLWWHRRTGWSRTDYNTLSPEPG